MTLNKSLEFLLYGSVLVLVLAIMYLMGVHTRLVGAAVAIFSPSTCYTAAATSTLAYMTPGLATTTVTCAMGEEGAQSATIAILVNASSTDTVFNVFVEQSMNGIDWYPIPTPEGIAATNPFVATTRASSQITFASTTIGGTALATSGSGVGLNGTQNRNHYILNVPVDMKRVRVYTGITGANAGLWMQIIPRQPIN